MENSNNLLKITEISEEMTSKDDRHYRVVRFQKLTQPGVFSNAKPRTRVLWEEGPMGSVGDSLYPHISAGRVEEGTKVLGTIETVEVEPYYILSENGKHADPETGEAANKATTFTSVVFEDENIKSLARSNDMTPKGEGRQATQEEINEEINEEVVA